MTAILPYALRILTAIVTLSLAILPGNANTISLPNEDLHYKINYKWGLIQKQAGKATLSLRYSPEGYKASLTASSMPWADRYYRLRDTLYSTMNHYDMLPQRYERIAHEKGKYARDIVVFTREGDKFHGKATRQRKGSDKDSKMRYAYTDLEATGPTVDLLSAFYYLRTLDFTSMKRGEHLTVNIFSGKQHEILNITYKGREYIRIDDVNYPSYNLVFTFTSDGKKKSSSDINAWISADDRRIPLKLEGSLPIGKIQCFYTGNGN